MTSLGVTPPISVAEPSAQELECTEELVSSLRSLNVFESDEESRRREKVLSRLNVLVKAFVRRISLARNLPEAVANEAGGKIFTFGSYRLGVHGAGADIDTLCVVPKYVQREDFFDDLYETLREMPEVSELTAVPDSYVPVIKMCFDGIPIDLVFARLGLSSVPDELELRDDNLLKNLDERCVRSLNGRAIYSNVMGFLGGVAWALAVARVCQLYPKATASTVVAKFFRIMGQWDWPQPVLLKPIDDGPLPMYPADRAHRMPIITPAYPSMCATHNVTASTLQIMITELQRAANISDKIMVGSAQWGELFAKHDFFHRYKYYLQVIASSDSIDDQRTWFIPGLYRTNNLRSALVESRLRHLVLKLEFVENLVLAHPFIKGFEHHVICSNEQQAIDAGRGIFPVEDKTAVMSNESQPPSADFRRIHTTTFYIGLAIEPRAPGDTAPRKLDISWPTSEFTKMCKQWEKFNEKTMGICVKYIKSSSLPNDVFDEGESRGKLKRGKSQAKSSNISEPVIAAETNGDAKPSKKHKASAAEASTESHK